MPRDWKKGFARVLQRTTGDVDRAGGPKRFGTSASLAGAWAMLDATTLDGLESASLLAW